MEDSRSIFNDALNDLLAKCSMYQSERSSDYMYGANDVCLNLEICQICNLPLVHSYLDTVLIETKEGQVVPLTVINLTGIYTLIAMVDSPVSSNIMELFADIHGGPKLAKTGDDLGDFLSGIGE